MPQAAPAGQFAHLPAPLTRSLSAETHLFMRHISTEPSNRLGKQTAPAAPFGVIGMHCCLIYVQAEELDAF
jgi:hypothetical protein